MTAPRVYIDTNMWIAVFEVEGEASMLAWSVLHGIEAGQISAYTSELTLAEVLPHPLARGDEALVKTYSAILTTGAGLVVVPVSRAILIEAAHLRSATMSLRLPDAIHVATALNSHCTAFLSEDLRLALPLRLRRVRLTDNTLRDIGAGA